MKMLSMILSIALGSMLMPNAVPAGSMQEDNKKAVVDFYEKAINQKDFEAASKYLGPRYIQHNQNAADGAEGLRKFLAFLREKHPQSHSTIKRVFTDGDFVILHVHAVRDPGTRGMAVVDIFRLENSRIVEHWDVHEDIIDKPANGNGMF